MIIGQRPLSSRHFFSSSSSHWHPTQNCCQCGQVFMFFFRTFGCEFDCRLLLGVVSCVMGAIKRSKTWTAQTQNYGTIRRGRKSHKRWLHKRTQFNPKSKNCTYILYVSLLKTINIARGTTDPGYWVHNSNHSNSRSMLSRHCIVDMVCSLWPLNCFWVLYKTQEVIFLVFVFVSPYFL